MTGVFVHRRSATSTRAGRVIKIATPSKDDGQRPAFGPASPPFPSRRPLTAQRLGTSPFCHRQLKKGEEPCCRTQIFQFPRTPDNNNNNTTNLLVLQVARQVVHSARPAVLIDVVGAYNAPALLSPFPSHHRSVASCIRPNPAAGHPSLDSASWSSGYRPGRPGSFSRTHVAGYRKLRGLNSSLPSANHS